MSKLTFDRFTKKNIHQGIHWKNCIGVGVPLKVLPRGSCRMLFTPLLRVKSENPMKLIQSGDSYTWKWHNWDGQENGKVLTTNGSDFMEISFADSKVSVSLEDHGKARAFNLKTA